MDGCRGSCFLLTPMHRGSQCAFSTFNCGRVLYGAEDTRLSWLTFPYILHTNLTLTVPYSLGLRTLCPEQAYDS